MKELFKDLKKESRDYYLSELNAQDSISEKFIDLRSLSLGIIQDLYDKRLVETKEDKEKVLQYILPLLKNNELVMLVHRYDKNNPSELIGTVISSPETAEKDIEILREEWNKFPDDPGGTEATTWFVLPKNKYILEEFIKPKERKEEKKL